MSEAQAFADEIKNLRDDEDPDATKKAIDDFVKNSEGGHLDELAELLRDNRELRGHAADVAAAVFVQSIDEDADTWDTRVSDWLTGLRDVDDEHAAFELASSAITWQLRSNRSRVLNALTLTTVLQEKENRDPNFETDMSILLQAARYDFNFERVGQLLEVLGPHRIRSSLYYRAMKQYSLLGRNDAADIDEIEAIADASSSEKTLSLLLHGLWFTAGERDAAVMLTIGEKLLTINAYNPVTHMRMAAAYRRQHVHGKDAIAEKFDKAIKSINRAISLLSPLEREAYADFKLERVTISTQMDAELRLAEAIEASSERMQLEFTELVGATSDAWKSEFAYFSDALEEKETSWSRQLSNFWKQMQAQLSDSLFKVVEILGLFTALIGLIASVVIGNAIGAAIPWYGRMAIIVTGGVITLAFFVLLRFIVKPKNSDASGFNSANPLDTPAMRLKESQ